MRWSAFLMLGAIGFACSTPERDFSDGHGGSAGDGSGKGGKGAVGGAAGRAGANASDAGEGGTVAMAEAGAAGESAGAAGESAGAAGENAGSGSGGGGAAGSGGSAGHAASGGSAGRGGSGGTAGSGGAPPALLADGAVCKAASDCSSNSCGGRCCPANKPCSCPQPSAQNLLKNPGFDSNVSGWTVTSSSGSSSFHWVAVDSINQDATACPYSGFGRIYAVGAATVSQCIAVSSSKSYNVSSSLSNGGIGEIACNLDWFTGADCTGSSVTLPDGALSTQWINGDWWVGNWLGGPWYPPSGVTSARLSCTDTCSDTTPCTANVDKMAVVEAPANY